MIIDLYGFGPALAAGALMTVQLALTALCLGLVLGLLGALAKTSPYKPLQWLGGTYSTLVRGVPELLWVLLIYFGTVNLMRTLGEYFGNPDLQLNAFAAGVIAHGREHHALGIDVARRVVHRGTAAHREADAVDALRIDRAQLTHQVDRAARVDLALEVAEVLLSRTERAEQVPAARERLGDQT